MGKSHISTIIIAVSILTCGIVFQPLIVQARPNYFETFSVGYTQAVNEYCELGILNERYEAYHLAIDDYTHAITLDSRCGLAYVRRGWIYVDHHEYDLALTDFNKVIEMAPDNQEIYKFRGELYQKMGKEELAQADFKRAEELEKLHYVEGDHY